ncbi:MAG TPA: BREX system serine/threonine kinase PglW, partial [Thermoanaerobaculia bacterium]|nr:BREX system serine/threonine kinase PglW [Thermoanaerobaculia bacterium]
MNETSQLWHQIALSEFPWERDALTFLRQGLPDHEPYRAWANLEFVAEDGTIHEVDVLVLSPKGMFLVEIKSWDGTLEGDATTWVLHQDGKVRTLDSPLLLANRKARKLASLLKHTKAARGGRFPFVEPLVFLSNVNLRCKLTGSARQGVHLRDREPQGSAPARQGILAALTRLGPAELRQARKARIDRPIAKAVARALAEIGIRPTQRSRRVGDYVLEELLFTGPGYQDWLARHVTLDKVLRRIRLYPVATAGAEARKQLERAARREIEALEPLSHPGLLKPQPPIQSDLGLALVFDHEPQAVRLDHYLKEAGPRLGFEDRLALVRQIAETLAYVHDKRVFHRALSPHSILVSDLAKSPPALRILDWQTAAHEALTSRTSHDGLSGTSHLDDLVGDAARVYVAPEALTIPDASPETLDVFSLGALAFFIFSGKPPARSALELHEALRTGKGLQLASALDGANPRLSEVIQLATHPVVAERLQSVTEFLDYLDMVEEKLTRPEQAFIPDPLNATAGQLLEGGFLVKKRLGKGSTSVVFLVEREGREEVLKLALDEEADERLGAEAKVVKDLDHERIVKFRNTVTVSGRFGLLLGRAGDKTLAQKLREEGRFDLELLQRYGEDLLQAADYLEKKGVPHRDIKPDNLGVAEMGRNSELHLILFDFSLTPIPADNIFAGTKPYLDPFLQARKPRRWDLQAERFAAGVTLYEMATGALPRWGDGKTHPGMLAEGIEVAIEAELLDAAVRAPLADFFRQALRRDPQKRFDNAQEMLAAWRTAFVHAERPLTTTTNTAEEQSDALAAACAAATLETSVSLLQLSTRAVNALERAQVGIVRELMRLNASRIQRMRGVGFKTRRELLEAIGYLRERFGPQAVAPEEAPETEIGEPDGLTPVMSVDLLVKQILPSARSRAEGERRTLETFLRLGGEAGAGMAQRGRAVDPGPGAGGVEARLGGGEEISPGAVPPHGRRQSGAGGARPL